MKECFQSWVPTKSSMDRLVQISRVLKKYQAMGIRLTLRQLFYQLVSQNIIPNTFREYKNLGTLLAKARLAGFIDWDIIEDRGRQPDTPQEFEDIKDLVKAALNSWRLPRMDDQPRYVELWCEKDALTSVIEPITRELHITFMANRGYSSHSAMYEASKRFKAAQDRGQTIDIEYIGDFDPSGNDMVRDVQERMSMFIGDDNDLSVNKLALNMDQVRRYRLPPNIAKTTDSRSSAFIDEHGGHSYEVDAIPPEILQQMIRSRLESFIDMKRLGAVLRREKSEAKKLERLVKGAA